MGWNQIEYRPGRGCCAISAAAVRLLRSQYYVPEQTIAAATCTYGTRYTAALEAGHVFGVQFHPEKSGRHRAADCAQLL
jgi:glutamine amidotransferase